MGKSRLTPELDNAIGKLREYVGAAARPEVVYSYAQPWEQPKAARFPLGCIVATGGALNAIAESGAATDGYLERHQCGDWGDLCAEDKRSNDEALTEDARIFSAYVLATGVKVWVITEADRSATTILLPSEY